GPPAFVPAFPDPAAVEKEFYERSGTLPLLHLVVIKERLAQDQPAVVEALCRAFLDAKQLAQSREKIVNVPEPGPGQTTSWMKDWMGDDPLAYGLKANEKPLNAFLAAARTQALNIHRFEVEDLFVPEIPDELK